MTQGRNRRDFLRGLAASGLVAAMPRSSLGSFRVGPNEKLNLGVIGTSGRALDNIEGVKGGKHRRDLRRRL